MDTRVIETTTIRQRVGRRELAQLEMQEANVKVDMYPTMRALLARANASEHEDLTVELLIGTLSAMTCVDLVRELRRARKQRKGGYALELFACQCRLKTFRIDIARVK